MSTVFSLDSLMDGYYESYLDFSKMSKRAIEERKERLETISNLKNAKNSCITTAQDSVDEKYWGIAYDIAEKKVKRNRTIAAVCLLIILFTATAFAGQIGGLVALPLWFDVFAAIYFFRSGYVTHIRNKETEKIENSVEYRIYKAEAQESDEIATKKQKEDAQEQLENIANQPYEYEWLLDEWMKIAQEVRSQAYSYGINSLVDDQSDEKLIGVVLNKMDITANPQNTKGVSYRQMMQTGKQKALDDWKACEIEIRKIQDMLSYL